MYVTSESQSKCLHLTLWLTVRPQRAECVNRWRKTCLCSRGAVCCLEATNVELWGEGSLIVLSFAFLSAHTNIPFDNSRSCAPPPPVCLVSAAGDHTRGGTEQHGAAPPCSPTSSCYITAAVAEAEHQMETFSNLSFRSRGGEIV